MMNQINLNSLSPQKLPPSWPRGLLTFIFIIFLLVVGGEVGIKYWNNRQQAKADTLNQELQTLREGFPSQQQEEIVLFEKKISLLRQLLNNHIYFSQDITALEELTHPEVYYNSLVFSPAKNSLALQGVAKNQDVLSEMLSGLVNNPQKVKMIVFHQARVNKNGSVDFSLDVYLQPGILHYHAPAPVPGENVSPTTNQP